MEYTQEVLTFRNINRCLTANCCVHLSEKSCRHLDDRNSTAPYRCSKPSQISRDSPSDRHDQIVATKGNLGESTAAALQGRESLVRLTIWNLDELSRQAMPVQRLGHDSCVPPVWHARTHNSRVRCIGRDRDQLIDVREQAPTDCYSIRGTGQSDFDQLRLSTHQ